MYAALTGIDWARARGAFREQLTSFEECVNRDVPKLHDDLSGQDRSFWRTSHGYLSAVNTCENSRPFRTPSRAAIPHKLDIDLIIAMRGLDTIGTAFMRSDGAAWLDDEGFGSLISSALPNDVMDLHTDIKTGKFCVLHLFLVAELQSLALGACLVLSVFRQHEKILD